MVFNSIANFLRINVYLTQKIGEDMLWNIAINDAGAEYDPLTLLRSRTMFGRPDWQSIYKTIRQAIESGQYIPGSNAQLKTKVGVSIWRHLTRPTDLTAHRHTSADLVFSPKPSRQLPFRILLPPSNSALPRFATTTFC